MAAPRLEIFSMKLMTEYTDQDMHLAHMYCRFRSMILDGKGIDLNRPWSVYVCDASRVTEIYNSVKANEFYTPFPRKRKMQHQHHSVGNNFSKRHKPMMDNSMEDKPMMNNSMEDKQMMDSMEEEAEEEEAEEEAEDEDEDDDDGVEEDDEQDSACSSKRNLGKTIDLHLTGPDADCVPWKNAHIVPWQYFFIIVHQHTGNPEDDLQKAFPFYRVGRQWKDSDLVCPHLFRGLGDYDYLIPFTIPVTNGLLLLEAIGYSNARLAHVEVRWFLNSIIGGGDEEIIDDPAATESYIRGKIIFDCTEHYHRSCVLLDTPKDKAINVAHGGLIRLLRCKVVVPDCKFFYVEATLRDPITNSKVTGSADFDFYEFPDEKEFFESKEIVGTGAKIEVAVTVQVNDMDYLSSSPDYYNK